MTKTLDFNLVSSDIGHDETTVSMPKETRENLLQLIEHVDAYCVKEQIDPQTYVSLSPEGLKSLQSDLNSKEDIFTTKIIFWSRLDSLLTLTERFGFLKTPEGQEWQDTVPHALSKANVIYDYLYPHAK